MDLLPDVRGRDVLAEFAELDPQLGKECASLLSRGIVLDDDLDRIGRRCDVLGISRADVIGTLMAARRAGHVVPA